MRAGAVLVVLALSGCAQTDLGSPCQLLTTKNQQVSPVPNETIVQSGNGACQQFVCVSFNGKAPICSQSCTQEGASCGSGMVCQAAILTPQLMTMLQQRTNGPNSTQYQQLTSGLTQSLYCGPGK